MSDPDITIHLDRARYASLWGDRESATEAFAFGEDDSMLARIIEEELGPPRRRRRVRNAASG